MICGWHHPRRCGPGSHPYPATGMDDAAGRRYTDPRAESEQLRIEAEQLRWRSAAAQQRSQALHQRSGELMERSRALQERIEIDRPAGQQPVPAADEGDEEHG